MSSHLVHPIANLNTIDLSSDCSSELTSSMVTPLSIDVEEVCSPSASSLDLHPANNTLSCSPSPATTVTPVKGLYSYFSTIASGTWKCPHHTLNQPSQPSPGQVCGPPTHTTPSSCKSNRAQTWQPPNNAGTSSVSVAYLNKEALNKAVKDGTFKCDEHKWATFKLKIMAIDPQSKVNNVDPRHACHILHVKCGKSFIMSMAYDTSLYKQHVQSCKSHTTKAGMHTLDNSLNFVLPLSGSSSVNSGICDKSAALWPCPGLSEDDLLIESIFVWQLSHLLVASASMQ